MPLCHNSSYSTCNTRFFYSEYSSFNKDQKKCHNTWKNHICKKKTHKSASVGCVISGSPSWLKLKFGFDVNINSTLSIRSFRLVSSKSALQVSLKQASTTIYPSVCPSVYKCQLQVSAPFYVSSNNLCDWLRVNPCDLQLCVMTVGHRQMSEQILASSIF